MKTFLSRTLAIAAKEIVQLRRDRLTFGMIIGIPALQLLLFGYAINTAAPVSWWPLWKRPRWRTSWPAWPPRNSSRISCERVVFR